MTGHDVLAKIELRILDLSVQLLNAEVELGKDPEDEGMWLRREELQLAADNHSAAWQVVNDIIIRGA
jgi:hypothetical protein